MAEQTLTKQEDIQSEAELGEVAKVFSALGNPVRLHIFRLIAAQEGCYCGELVQELGMAQSTISHHLKILKEAGLIKGAEHGTWVCYCADRPRIDEFKRKLDLTLDGEPGSGGCACK